MTGDAKSACDDLLWVHKRIADAMNWITDFEHDHNYHGAECRYAHTDLESALRHVAKIMESISSCTD